MNSHQTCGNGIQFKTTTWGLCLLCDTPIYTSAYRWFIMPYNLLLIHLLSLCSDWFYNLYISCAVIRISSYTNGRLVLCRSRVYLCKFHSGDSKWPGKFELWTQLHFHACTEFVRKNSRSEESTSSNTFTFTQTIADYLAIFPPMESPSRSDDPFGILGSVNNLSVTDHSTPNVLTQSLNLDSNSSQKQTGHTSDLSVGSEPTLG